MPEIPVSTLTAAKAYEFRFEHDQETRSLTRKSKAELEAIAAGERAKRGYERLYGQSSKDELVREILEFRYPVARLNEAGHVLYHKPGETWDACEYCHPHQGSACHCGISREPAQ